MFNLHSLSLLRFTGKFEPHPDDIFNSDDDGYGSGEGTRIKKRKPKRKRHSARAKKMYELKDGSDMPSIAALNKGLEANEIKRKRKEGKTMLGDRVEAAGDDVDTSIRRGGGIREMSFLMEPKDKKRPRKMKRGVQGLKFTGAKKRRF